MASLALGAASLLTSVGGAFLGHREEKKTKKKGAAERLKVQKEEEEKRRARLAGIQRSEGVLTSTQGVMENAQVGRRTLLGG